MQEFAPQEQSKTDQAQDSAEEQTPYYSAGKQKKGDILKEEHPTTFEDAIPPYSYPAQDREMRQRTERPHEQRQTRRQFEVDGDAFESGYRPHRQYPSQQQVPWWARPQQQANNNGVGKQVFRWILIMALAFIIIKAIPLILGLFAVVALIILIPILILFALVIAFLVLLGLGVPIGRGRWLWRAGRNRRNQPWRW